MVAAVGGSGRSSPECASRAARSDGLSYIGTRPTGSASLILGKVYPIVPDARAANDNLLRIIDESGEDYLFARSQFEVVEFPQAVRRRLLALRRAG